MEKLFTTNLTVNGQSAPYEVVFENDQYVFHPLQGDQTQTFSIKREEDEWHPQDQMNEELQAEGIAALEKYLLSQH